MPGDTIKMEVYAKYLDPNKDNWNEALTNMMAQMAPVSGGQSGAVDGGTTSSGTENTFPFGDVMAKSTTDDGAPRAYLNYLVFDKNYNPILSQSGYKKISEAAKENGSDADHEKLSHELAITEPGFVYIYLSNEEETPVEVFFDDFTVTQVAGPVIQMDDYYPFGLTFNSSHRENTLPNKWKFQGQQHVDELGLGWDSFKWRNHMPEIGRFFNVDPLAEKYYYNSPYAFSENKVTSHVELEGLEAEYYLEKEIRKVEGVMNNLISKVESVISEVVDAVTQKGPTESEKKNAQPIPVEEKQQTQIPPTEGALNLNGTTNPLYNPNGTAEGGGEGKQVMTQAGGQTKVNNVDNKKQDVKIDTVWAPTLTRIDDKQKDSTFWKREYRTSDGKTGIKTEKASKGTWSWTTD